MYMNECLVVIDIENEYMVFSEDTVLCRICGILNVFSFQ